MKSVWVFGLIYILLLPLLAIGCDKTGPDDTAQAQTISIKLSLDDFAAQKDIVKDVQLTKGQSLKVDLGSNPTTGYKWEDAVISDTNIIDVVSSDFLEPTDTAIVGAPGTDVRVFEAKTAGTATIKISYSRSWEGQGIYSLTINVTVK